MKHFLSSLAFVITLVLLVSCNDVSQSYGKNENDTTSTANANSSNRIEFDTSKSITSISPNLYKKLSDTLGIRIVEGTYKPGDSSTLHAHPDFALYVLEGSTVELTSTEGEKQNVEFTKGMAVVLPASTHSAKNIGRSTLRLIVVEVNRPRS